jgi:cell wall-associated NlpC family hydrolase
MKTLLFIAGILAAALITGCGGSRRSSGSAEAGNSGVRSTVIIKNKVPPRSIDTRDITGGAVVRFAQTLIGVRYTYGSSVREKGFDCSGFINYVFSHFKISVPRSSVDFTNAGTEVTVKNSLPGDIILFTGSDQKSGVVGHMGIITENRAGVIRFIHASESRGVMISDMNSYFLPHFVKINRIFTIF